MLRTQPPGEDPVKGTRAVPVTINAHGTPPGEDGIERARAALGSDQIENDAQAYTEQEGGEGSARDDSIDFLGLVREAEDQAMLYVQQINRKAWAQTYRAFHQEHYVGSKYTKPDWRGRSKLFVPKTRAAVRKDMAAVAASLFNNIDAINCLPGNEGDPQQRAAAAIMEELVNYRTDRSSGKAALPWFMVSMGARQDALLTGVCCSKQYWKQEFRKDDTEEIHLPNKDSGVYEPHTRDVFVLEIDRPDMVLIPPENFIIDPAADWTNPAQSAAFFTIKWPMQIEEIKAKQEAPVNPWKELSEAILTTSLESGKYDMAAIRRAREMGLDRLDETQTGTHFQVVWVYENFMRVDGEDYTFYSLGDQYYLTDPKPVREVYPEQFGERPIALGYGNLESHRIYPMAAAESWQQLQWEVNDLRNLRLDATKQNVMPISKVVRGKQIDLDQVRRRASGSSIIVTNKDDVTWEQSPSIPEAVVEMSRELDIEFDDLAGVQNYGNVQQNNALGKTLGGLKLAAGAANAVQEFDIRVWIETWAQPALSQVVRLEQYYESDATVLGLCGQRAQLLQKYGVDKITNELLEQEITVRVSVGLGAGDPQQRLAKFQSAATIVAPLLQSAPEFQSGQVELNWEAVVEEVFGAAGYKDGGQRFFKDNGQPRANPMLDLKTQELQAKIEKDKRTGKAAMLTGLAAVAKIALGRRELEANVTDMLLGHQMEAKRTGFEHGHRHNEQHLSALDHGHRHGLAIADHRRNLANDARTHAREDMAAQNAGQDQEGDGGGAGQGAPTEAASAAAGQPSTPSMGPQGPSPASPPPTAGRLTPGTSLQFTRDPRTNRITGAKIVGGGETPVAPPPPQAAGIPPPDPTEERMKRLEVIAEKLSKPRHHRVVRDANNKITGVEDTAA